MALDPTANLVKVTVSTGYDASATTIVLAAGQGAKFPAVSFNVTWWNSTDYPDPSDDPNVEIVRVTNVSIDTLTVTRNQESSGAHTHNTAGKTYQMLLGITSKMITDIGNLIVGWRTNYQNFTTAGGDTSFVLTPPGSATATAVLMVTIGTQQLFQGVGSDYTVSGNTITLVTAYPSAGAPVIVIYTY